MREVASIPEPPSDADAYERWRRRERLQQILNYVIVGLLLATLGVAVFFAMQSEIFNNFKSSADKAMGWGTEHIRH